MKTAGARLSDEEYEALKDYAKGKGSNVNAILGKLVRGVTEGKAEPTQKDSTSKIPLCPHCDHLLFYYFPRSEMACPNCGYYFEIEEPRWQQGKAPKI
ncbi:MAG: hypothetical protein GH144_06635 [Clostridia bacterium]|nr:hypothetical protein [Clostridia bacterium]